MMQAENGCQSDTAGCTDSDQIAQWIENRLCEENDLMPGAFPMTQQVVNKQGNLCGTLFCLHGPRSVRLLAVYDWVTERILTYDSQGCRTGEYDATTLQDNLATAGKGATTL